MMTIYKYPLNIQELSKIPLPKNAKVLSFQFQHLVPCIWAQIDTEQPLVDRTFYIFGTGREFPKNIALNYIGTCQESSLLSSYVWHLYEQPIFEG